MKTSSFHDGKLRVYRLAVVGSGEYSQYHLRNQGVPDTATNLEKKAAVLSAINTTMTRVNAIFERDISVRMVLVANNDDIIFLDPDTDGIDYSSASSMLHSSRVICNDRISDENYDMGHMFGIGLSGGVASGRICDDSDNKSNAVSLHTREYYSVRVVAHEIGHQFGANHTQNNPCNRSNINAVEPGSGSTLMGYAGVCSPNVQRSSDYYFHIKSIEQMWYSIRRHSTCGTEVDMGNTPPVILSVGIPNADNRSSYVEIPKSTPFVLRGSAADSNSSSSLTYTWEQNDGLPAPMPPLPTNVEGPMFRSLPPSSSPNRYMPDLAIVVAGSTASTWEVLPFVSRDMRFIFTARDNNPGGGSFANRGITVGVNESAGPFKVTSQTTNVLWNAGTEKEVTWDVSGTNTGNINTQTVNILLSIDGGQTFPITLASAVPNDGSHTITVPRIEGVSNQARVMVEANDNIFYAVNSSDFTVDGFEYELALDNPNIVACSPNTRALFKFTYQPSSSRLSYFSAVGLPENVDASFSPPSTASKGARVSLLVTGTIENEGSYPFQIQTITGGNIMSMVDATMQLYNSNLSTPILNTPSNGETNVNLAPKLRWSVSTNATSYDLEVATDINFNMIILRENIVNNFYTFSEGLDENTTYYWRIKPKNPCTDGGFSSVNSFTTTSCTICPSVGEIEYVEVGTTRVVFNTIDNSSTVEVGYNDYRNISTNVVRGDSYILSIRAKTLSNLRTQTIVWIDWNQDCVFNEENESYHLGSVVNVDEGLTDRSPLSISIPTNASLGRTVMRVITKHYSDPSSCENDFFGEVEDYSIVVQEASTASKTTLLSKNNDVEDFSFEGFDLYPNPTQGMFTVRFKTVSKERVFVKVMDLSGRTVFAKKYKNVSSDFSERVVLDNVSSGIYLLQIENGGKQTTRKLLIE